MVGEEEPKVEQTEEDKLRAQVAALSAEVAQHRANYRRIAQTLSGLVSGLLSAAEAPQ